MVDPVPVAELTVSLGAADADGSIEVEVALVLDTTA